MSIEELTKLISLITQLTALAASQYQAYKQAQGLTDEEMQAELKSLNAADAQILDQIIASAG